LIAFDAPLLTVHLQQNECCSHVQADRVFLAGVARTTLATFTAAAGDPRSKDGGASMSPITEREVEHVHQVSASLNYLGEMSERPFFHVHHRVNDNLKLVPHAVTIGDARGRHTSLDVEGFCLLEHRSSVNLQRRRAVASAYGAEMERLIRELTGAAKVSAAAMGVLRVVESSSISMTVHRPVRFVHADCTDDSARMSLRRRFAGEDELPSGCRCAIYHVWRTLTPAPQDAPLALCDGRTVEARDCVPADTILDSPGSRLGRTEATLCRYNAEHRWYYFPHMTRDEVLVFKDFDSDAGHPCRVLHTAFEDPTCPAGVPARVSLDLQLFAIF
jgi:hypothetical protein